MGLRNILYHVVCFKKSYSQYRRRGLLTQRCCTSTSLFLVGWVWVSRACVGSESNVVCMYGRHAHSTCEHHAVICVVWSGVFKLYYKLYRLAQRLTRDAQLMGFSMLACGTEAYVVTYSCHLYGAWAQ
jgi:hypothetical protein